MILRPHRILFIISIAIIFIVSFLSRRNSTSNILLERWDREETTRVHPQQLKIKSTQQTHRKLMTTTNIERNFGNPLLRTTNHNHSRISANNNLQLPQLYGWVPDAYPDPISDPIRCRISSLENQHFTHHLRLCDPDMVLGIPYLKSIADALDNFTETRRKDPFVEEERSENRVRLLLNQQSTAKILDTHQDLYGATRSELSNNAERVMRSSKRFLLDGDDNAFPPIEIAVAIVRKINLPVVLRQGSFYTYEDEDDMVNDAAQIFARSLHDAWWKPRPGSIECGDDTEVCEENPQFGILIFLSINDRVCFISTGTGVSTVLPWWRLEHIVSNMKPDLRLRAYGSAILHAIEDISEMIETGPPSISDRMHDFASRFGVVIGFAIFTFLFGLWGEYRDRRKRWEYTESQSRLSKDDKKKARQLQKRFHTQQCPICLEPFPENNSKKKSSSTSLSSMQGEGNGMKRVDSFIIPTEGPDGKAVKMLRCGHIFCQTCWKLWIDSGNGDPLVCPVCRQNVGKCRKVTHELCSNNNVDNAPTEVIVQQQQESSGSTSLWNRGFSGREERRQNESVESTGDIPRETDALLLEASRSSATNNNYSSTGYFWGTTEL